MNCKKCGVQLFPDDNFCRKCNAAVSEPMPQSAPYYRLSEVECDEGIQKNKSSKNGPAIASFIASIVHTVIFLFFAILIISSSGVSSDLLWLPALCALLFFPLLVLSIVLGIIGLYSERKIFALIGIIIASLPLAIAILFVLREIFLKRI